MTPKPTAEQQFLGSYIEATKAWIYNVEKEIKDWEESTGISAAHDSDGAIDPKALNHQKIKQRVLESLRAELDLAQKELASTQS